MRGAIIVSLVGCRMIMRMIVVIVRVTVNGRHFLVARFAI